MISREFTNSIDLRRARLSGGELSDKAGSSGEPTDGERRPVGDVEGGRRNCSGMAVGES